MKSAAQVKRAENARRMLAELQKPRPVDCKVCGKKITITGAHALKLCPVHKAEHTHARDIERARENRARAKAIRTGLVPDVRPTGDLVVPPGAPAIVREAPPEARHQESDRTHPPVEKGIQRGTFADAIRLISAPAARREGYRHGWIGNTGMGKTTAIKHFLEAARIFTLVHDDTKLDPQYGGTVAARFDDAPDDAYQITIRGDAFKGTRVEVETVAALALQIARGTREPVRLVIDELDRACSPGGKQLESAALRECFTLGRSLSVSVLWSTQTPQRAPVEVIDQSSTIALCQLGPRALNYLDERLCFDADLLQVVPTLAVGEFAIYESGRTWNRTIYRSPA